MLHPLCPWHRVTSGVSCCRSFNESFRLTPHHISLPPPPPSPSSPSATGQGTCEVPCQTDIPGNLCLLQAYMSRLVCHGSHALPIIFMPFPSSYPNCLSFQIAAASVGKSTWAVCEAVVQRCTSSKLYWPGRVALQAACAFSVFSLIRNPYKSQLWAVLSHHSSRNFCKDRQ